jgi:NAD-dependent SIR2 family protein deacetylase
MNKELKNIHQCSQCKKDFPEQEAYRIGTKKKDFFCRDCANNIKSNCMWCGKNLEQKKWKRLGGYGIKSEEGKLTETIDRDNLDGDKHHRYYLICEEGRE